MIKYTLIFLISSFSFLVADVSFSPIPIEQITQKKKYAVGKWLYFDTNLSKDKTVSCATCHDFSLGGSDNLKTSKGIEGLQGKLNAPTIFNAKYNIAQDWIGEVGTIKERAKLAFLNKIEMAGDFTKLIEYITKHPKLSKAFLEVYSKISQESILDALSYYTMNLTTPNARFDKYINGDVTALSKEELQGYRLFKEYGCASCHNGINLGGNMYQKFGIFNEENLLRDDNLGRYQLTSQEYDRYVFKVPSLRNISRTAPYSHNGSIKSLRDMIAIMGEFQLGIKFSTSEIEKIERFLKTLDGEIPYE